MNAPFTRNHRPGHGQFQTIDPHTSWRRSIRDGLTFAERKEQEKRNGRTV